MILFSLSLSLARSLSLSLSFSFSSPSSLVVSNSNKQTRRETSREARAICCRLPADPEKQRYIGGIAANIAIRRAGNARRLKSRKAKRYYKTSATERPSDRPTSRSIDCLMKTPTRVLFGFPRVSSFFFIHCISSL